MDFYIGHERGIQVHSCPWALRVSQQHLLETLSFLQHIFLIFCQKSDGLGLEKWLSGSEHWLLFQGTQVEFATHSLTPSSGVTFL